MKQNPRIATLMSRLQRLGTDDLRDVELIVEALGCATDEQYERLERMIECQPIDIAATVESARLILQQRPN